MSSHPAVLAVIVIGFSAVVSLLAPRRGWRAYAGRTCVMCSVLLSLMGMGAVFGKVLGDFLRGVN